MDSASDEYLKIISDKICDLQYIEQKKVEDIKNLLIELLGKYITKNTYLYIVVVIHRNRIDMISKDKVKTNLFQDSLYLE